MAALSATFAAAAVVAAPKGKAPRSGFRAAMAPKAVAPKCRAAAPAGRRAQLQVSALVNGRYEWDQVHTYTHTLLVTHAPHVLLFGST